MFPLNDGTSDGGTSSLPDQQAPPDTATLSIEMPDGSIKTATVAGGFRNLSQTDQIAMVGRIRQQALTNAAPVKDTSFTGALRYGAEQPLEGLAATARVAGGAADSPTLTGVGRSLDAVAKGIGPGDRYDPAAPKMAEALRQGNYGDLWSRDGVRAVAESVPGLMGALVASRVPGGLPTYLAGTSFGNHTEARAANNDHATPTAGDMIGGAVASVPDVALGMVGLGKVPGVSAALSRVPTAVGRVAAGAATDAVAGAAGSVADQAGNTLGTTKGLSVDPAEAATAGLTTGAARAGTLASGEVASGTGAAARAATGATFEKPSTEAAQSIERVNAAADAYRSNATATTGRTPSDAAVLDQLHTRLANNAAEIGRQLRDAGGLSPDDHRTVQTAIRDAASFKPDSPGDAGPLPSTASLADLDIPEAIRGPLISAVSDLATLSAARRSDPTGPFAKAGHATATLGTAGSLLAAGNPIAAGATLLGAKEVSRLGGVIGGLVDSVAGTAAPAVFLRRGQAQSVLRATDAEAGQDSVSATQAALATLRDPTARLNLSLGLPLDTPATPPAPTPAMTSAQQARGVDLSEHAGRSIEQIAVQNAIMKARTDATIAAQQANGDPDAIRAAVNAPAAPAWKPGDPPIGLGVIQRAEMQARLNMLAAATQKRTVPAVAQRQIDSDTLRASATLAAEHLTPGGQGAGNDTAVAAAIATAAMRAAMVRKTAFGGQDAADRVSVGLPAHDAVPVNTPLGTDGTPLAGGRSNAFRATPGAAPQAATADAGPLSAAGGQTTLGTLPSGWMSYVLSGLMRNGIAAKPSDVHGALDDLATSGELSPTHVSALKAHAGPIMVPELLNRIGARTAQRTGQGDRLDAGLSAASGAATSSDRGPIRDPIRWNAAREDAKAAAEGLANQAERMSDHPLATTIRHIAAEPTSAGKARIAQDYVSSIKGDRGEPLLRKARAAQLLNGPLMKGV